MMSGKLYPPNGWKTLYQMEKEWSLTSQTIRRRIVKLSNLECKEYISHPGRTALFYSPVSVEAIKEALGDIINTEAAPEGWLTIPMMAKEFGVSRQAIHSNKSVDGLKGLEILKIKTPYGQAKLYYSPESVEAIRGSMKNVSS